MDVRLLQKPLPRALLLFSVPTILLIVILVWSIVHQEPQQYVDLAQGFLHGHLYFLRSIGGIGNDPVLYKHHEYWSNGAFPAIVLLPFVALFDIFGWTFSQRYIEWLLVLGTLYLTYSLARKFKYSTEDSLFLMFGFTLGSTFAGIAIDSSAWMYAQALTTFILFWSLYEFFTRKRWWLVGMLCFCIFLARQPAALIVIFYGLELLRTSKERLITRFLPLVVPLTAAIALQALYNFARFHNPLNNGSQYQLLAPVSAESRALGVLSIRHIPANLYFLVFSTPDTVPITNTSWSLTAPFIKNNPYGTSIFITSPYFIYLFGRKWAAFSQTARNLLIASALSCLAILCFYGIGRSQFGYRYSLDFLPGLFVVFMLVYKAEHKQLSRGMKFLILGTIACNYYLLMSFAAAI
jgi:hypothetical protein